MVLWYFQKVNAQKIIVITYLMSCTEIYVRLCLMSANDDVYAYQQRGHVSCDCVLALLAAAGHRGIDWNWKQG